jgi:hypothetical protein
VSEIAPTAGTTGLAGHQIPATPPTHRRAFLARVTRRDARMTGWELATVFGVLLIVSATTYASNAVHSGFISDDWANRATYLFGDHAGFWGGLHSFLALDNVKNRPLNAVYLAFEQSIFGWHMGWYLAASAALAAPLGTTVYALLRTLRFAPWEGFLVALLLVLIPAGSSQRLWIAASGAQGSVALALVGVTLAIWAFRSAGSRSLALHGISLVFYAMSVLWYESALATILACVVLYRLETSWRPALTRWAVDVATLGAIALFITSKSNFPRQGLSGEWHHVQLMWDSAQTLLTARILPFPSDRWFALVPLVAILAMGLAVWVTDRSDLAFRREVGRWLAMAIGGLAVVALGYAMYVPAIDYYEPGGPGIANRINNVAGIGWVLVVFGAIGLISVLVFRRARPTRVLHIPFVVAACGALIVSWLPILREDARTFRAGFDEGQRTLRTVKLAVPRPSPGTVVYVSAQPIEIKPGFPVFGNSWDTTSAIQFLWHDKSLVGLPVWPETQFLCDADGVRATGRADYASGYKRPYGKVLLVNSITGDHETLMSRRQCERDAARFPRSPAFPPPPPA